MKNPYGKTGLAIRYTLISVLMAGLTFLAVILADRLIEMDYEEEALTKIDLVSTYIESRIPDYLDAGAYVEETLGRMLLAAGTGFLDSGDPVTTETLEGLVSAYGLLSALWTNPEGEVILSSDPALLGLSIGQGHPLYPFLTGDETVLIEEVRQSQATRQYVKNGNFKTPEGNILQLSVRVDVEETILGLLSLESVVLDIMETGNVLFARFIDPDGYVIAHNDPAYLGFFAGEIHESPTADDAPRSITGYKGIEGITVHLVSTPVVLDDGTFIGVLNIGFDPAFVLPAISSSRTIAITAGAMLYIILMIAFHLHLKARATVWDAAYVETRSGLPSMNAFDRSVEKTLKRHGEAGALLSVVDRYDLINGLNGPEVAGAIIKTLASRIADLATGAICHDRYPDGLAVILKDEEDATRLADAVTRATAREIDVFGQVFMVTVTTAIVSPSSDNTPHVLRTRLSSTIDEAGTRAKGHILYHDHAMVEAKTKDNAIERALKDAIKDPASGRLSVVFQPQISLKNGDVIGFETLARLSDPAIGPVSPVDFIRIAEERGMIRDLDRLVLLEAIRFHHAMKNASLVPKPLSLNVSMSELIQYGFAEEFKTVLSAHGIGGGSVVLELSEKRFLDPRSDFTDILARLRSSGVKIAVDDFGTGYQSLDALSGIGIDYVKLDRTFVQALVRDPARVTIGRAIIAISRSLGAQVIAEGVETTKEKKALMDIGCCNAQGYLFARPLSQADALDYLSRMTEKRT
jgi:EAL domain-containing protein (putative c-di-GMP-specific phosphodiesterase class I)/GGDEF domain-containing protein